MESSTIIHYFVIMFVETIILAVLSVAVAFCRTQKSTDYKNKVNIGKRNYIIIYPVFFVLNITSMLFSLFDYKYTADLFSIVITMLVFAIQAVTVYLTMFKKFQCYTGEKIGKSIVFALISTPYYNILFTLSIPYFMPCAVLIPIPFIIGLFIYCITS